MILIILIQLADSNFLDLERRIIIRIKLILKHARPGLPTPL